MRKYIPLWLPHFFGVPAALLATIGYFGGGLNEKGQLAVSALYAVAYGLLTLRESTERPQ